MQQYSSYFQELDDTAKQRCNDKMRKIGVLVDPYLLQKSSGVEWQLGPARVEYPDAVYYGLAVA